MAPWALDMVQNKVVAAHTKTDSSAIVPRPKEVVCRERRRQAQLDRNLPNTQNGPETPP